MTLSDPTQPTPPRFERSVAIVVLLALGICALLLWQHAAQRSALHATARDLEEIRQARIELADGFLHLSLADAPGSPFSQDSGQALLRQAMGSFERALARHASPDTASLERFRHSAGDFERLLGDWTRDRATQPWTLVALRITYGDLRRQAEQLDAQTRQRLAEIAAHTDRNFAVTLGGSALALLLTIALVVLAARRQRHSMTLREQARQALSDSEARFQATFEQAAMGLALVAPDGHWLRVNRKLCEIVGYGPDELPSLTFGDITHPDDLDADLDCVRRMLAREIQTYAMEKRYIRKDGRLIWVNLSVALVWKADGTPDYFISVVEDIQARKQAEQALRESEAKRLAQASAYRSVIETAMDGFCMLDAEGHVLAVNDAYVRHSGYSREELLGMRISDLEALEAPLEVAGRLRRIRAEGSNLFETQHRRKDGELWPVEVSVSFSPDDGGCFRGFIRDISERKRTEQAERERQAEALREQHQAQLAALNLMEDAIAAREHAESAIASLRESEQRLLMAQEGARVGIWEWDPATDRMFCSPECHRLHGLPPDSVRTHDDWRARVLPEDRPRIDAEWAKQLGCQATFELEFRVRLDSGEIRWLVSKGGTQCDASGRPWRMSGITMDVTERKHLLEELAQYRLHLEDLVAVRTAELAAARTEAERLARAKGDFLANMSHEIRTPLGAVLGLARMGARDCAGRGVQGTFERILEAGEHLLGVINDILDYSKIEAGRLGLESRPFRLGAVVATACDLQSLAARDKGLAFRVEERPGLPDWVLGDPHRLQQVLFNLLSNAVKFTAHGEVSLCVEQVGQETVFRVTDSGIGMTPEQLSRLFRPFEQADGSTTRRYGGTGLGLAISHDLARLMGGDILASSVAGQGSCFVLRLTLPSTAPALEESPDLQDSSAGRLAGLRVLAAEDVEVNRLILEDLLEHEQARVTLVENGRLALERLRAEGGAAFDIVLMDVQMPEMDGYEATRHIRALAPGLPVIGLTAHALPEERAKCQAAGMLDHVTKPIDPETLIAAILHHAHRDRAAPVARDPASARPSPAMPEQPPAARLIDWDGLRQRYQGRDAFIDKLTRLALEVNSAIPAQLRAALQAGDFKELAFIAHSIKGSAGNLEAHAVTAVARETELAAKAGQPDAVALAETLVAMVETLTAELTARAEMSMHCERQPEEPRRPERTP